jgi:hypothetical protein
MTARTKEYGSKNKIIEPASSTYPYEMYRGTRVWKVVEKAINDLVDNKDLVEKTPRDYIVGYMCKKLRGIVSTAPGHRSN